MTTARYTMLGLALLLVPGSARVSTAQSIGAKPPVAAADRGAISLALTFDAAAASITSSSSFWMKGGSAELDAGFVHGFGLTASITGQHTGNSGGGVPINLVVATFGPSYSLAFHAGRRQATLFAHGLIGEANGFSGLYPKSLAPDPSTNGLAAKVGGGLDLKVSQHISVRVVEANWLRTQLTNSTTNVQNDVELGAGIVFHTARR